MMTDEPDGQSGQRAAILGKICLICVHMVDKVEYFPGDRRYLQGFLFLIEGQTALASVIAERMRDYDQCGKRITSRGMGTCFKKSETQ